MHGDQLWMQFYKSLPDTQRAVEAAIGDWVGDEQDFLEDNVLPAIKSAQDKIAELEARVEQATRILTRPAPSVPWILHKRLNEARAALGTKREG